MPNGDIPNGFGPHSISNIIDPQSSMIDNGIDGFKFEKGKLVQLNKVVIENEKLTQLSKSMVENDASTAQITQEGTTPLNEEIGAATGFSDLLQQCVGQSLFAKQDSARPKMSVSAARSALNFSLATSFHSPNTLAKKELNKVPSFQLGEMADRFLPKLFKTGHTNRGTASESRVPRPPAEGRGRSQLLPRYWPRITDQELQQISGKYP